MFVVAFLTSLAGSLGCGPGGGNGTAAEETISAQRDSVMAFWRSYREATRQRLSGEYENALRSYGRALTHDSTHEDALYYMGNVALELGQTKVAETSWIALTRINPSSSRGFLQLGTLYLCEPSSDLFDLTRAESGFRQAVRLNREETGGLLRLGELHLVSGAMDSALTYFGDVLVSNPASTRALLLRGFAQWRAGDASAVDRTIDAIHSLSAETIPEGMSSEGDTRSGPAPLLSPEKGCQLFDPFDRQIDAKSLDRQTLHEMYSVLTDRISAVRQ